MSIRIYMDVHIPRAVVHGLRLRGVEVLRAQDDDAGRLPDPALLDRATALGCLLFTFDDDLLQEAARRQQSGMAFGRLADIPSVTSTPRVFLSRFRPAGGTYFPASIPQAAWMSRPPL